MFKRLVLGLLLLPNAAVFAQPSPCAGVVEDTVAELKAGAAGWWSAEAEALVRTSAGSACVKALSSRYGVGGSNDVNAEALEPDTAATAAKTDEEPLDFKPLSGSPAKKPFERRRVSDDS